MATVTLTEKIRGADQHLLFDDKGTVIAMITAEDYAALALPGAQAPKGVDQKAWEAGTVIAGGNIPDYGSGQTRLQPGEYAEMAEGFELCFINKDAKVCMIFVKKEEATYSKDTGLTLVTAWEEGSTVISLQDGVLTTE